MSDHAFHTLKMLLFAALWDSIKGANHWIIRSAVLQPDFVVYSKTDNDTEHTLRECVNLRICPSILDKTKLNTNTQKVEVRKLITCRFLSAR